MYRIVKKWIRGNRVSSISDEQKTENINAFPCATWADEEEVRDGGMPYQAEDFQIYYVLGSGSYGTVVCATKKKKSAENSTFRYALKSINKAEVVRRSNLDHLIDEKRLLQQMDSRFIVKFFGSFQTNDQIFLVTELLENDTLTNVIYDSDLSFAGMPKALLRFYAASLVLALSHIHSKGVAYRDLKPENVMLDRKGYIRIIDFGFAKSIPYTSIDKNSGEEVVCYKSFTSCGTPEYLAPEVVTNQGHGPSADLWSLGTVIYEISRGESLFHNKNEFLIFKNIADAAYSVRNSGFY